MTVASANAMKSLAGGTTLIIRYSDAALEFDCWYACSQIHARATHWNVLNVQKEQDMAETNYFGVQGQSKLWCFQNMDFQSGEVKNMDIVLFINCIRWIFIFFNSS